MQIRITIWRWDEVWEKIKSKVGRELNDYERLGLCGLFFDLAELASMHPLELADFFTGFESVDDGDDWTLPSHYLVKANFGTFAGIHTRDVPAAA